MTGVTFTSPSECAECGESIREEIARAEGLAATGFTIEDQHVMVPGLYSHARCAMAVMDGERETRVTLGAALGYLAAVFIPSVAAYMARHDGEEFEAAHKRLGEAVNVAEILTMAGMLALMEEAADEEGVSPEDMAIVVIESTEQHPREVVTLN